MNTQLLANLRLIESKKNWSNKAFRIGFSIIFFETITGTYLAFKTQLGHYDIFIMLGHLLLGFFIWISTFMFVSRHLIYRRIWQSVYYDLLGKITSIFMLFSAASGTYLFFSGLSGEKEWWYIHLLSSYLGIAGLGGYVFLTLKYSFQDQKDNIRKSFKKMLKNIFLFILFFTCFFGLVIFLLGFLFEPKWKTHRLKESNSSTHLKVSLTGSKSCGTSGCHVDIYNQWTSSTHGNTPNPFVFASMKLMLSEGKHGELIGKNKEEVAHILKKQDSALVKLRECLACHSPGTSLSGNLVRPIDFEEMKKDEGVSCLYCHSINHVNDGPGRGSSSYEMNKFKTYAFEESENKMSEFFNKILINAKPSSHRFNLTNSFYQKSEYCIGCHNLMEYTSWLKSPYHLDSRLSKQKSCQNCHMPQVKSTNDASGKLKGTVTDHRFISAGLSMAVFYKKKNQFEDTKHKLQDKIILTEIIAPKKVRIDSEISFSLFVGNSGVGHSFPSGPEGDLTEAWPAVTVTDQDGSLVYSSGELDGRGYFKSDPAKVYKIIPFDENDQLVGTDRHRSWKYRMYLTSVIQPRMYDEIKFQIFIPKIKKRIKKILIESRFNFRKPNQEYADWVFGIGKFLVPVVEMDKTSVSIETTRDEKEAAKQYELWKIRLKDPQGMVNLKQQHRALEMEMKPTIKTKTGEIDSY